MVDIMGHIAFGLLFALPAWFLWDDRASVGFIALSVVASLFPDVDLWLVKLFPTKLHHHGLTHTVLFVTIASLVGGVILAGLFRNWVDRWIESERFDTYSLVVFSSTAFLTGSLSHLVADMLSAPDISTPIEPFWPFFGKPWSLDLLWYNAMWINAGFLLGMVALHLALAYLTTPVDHRYRLLSR